VLRLLRALRFPVFAEATSQLRFQGAAARSGVAWCDELAVVLDCAAARRLLDPDLVLQLGAPPVSAGWEDLLEGPSVREHVVVAEHGFPDPVSTATLLLQGPVAATASALLRELETALGTRPATRPADAWLGRLRRLCDGARSAVEALLRDGGGDGGATGLGEGAVARAVAEALPAGALLALGNSLPIRSMEAFAPAPTCSLRVWSQRGLAGIDGLLSGVAGSLVALGAEPAPPPAAAILVGDLSFLHDLGGLATLRRIERPIEQPVEQPAEQPLAVVVVQNRGGRIFEQLPLASAPSLAGVLPHFVMTQELDVGAAASAFGLPFARVSDRAGLQEALAAAFGRAGATVIEAIVPEHAAAAERAALRRAMATAASSLAQGQGGAGAGP
jgi:2-succinyl-5-enolpyruvyl-6-hydroxy-3-cyclohexene-1-carboxylate synthase